VWLGFFLHEVLTRFAEVARRHGDTAMAEQCDQEAAALRLNIDQHAWDGRWYLRAWFDDGSPLGSSGSAECAIDSISQSWSVLSHAGNMERSREAMDSVDRHLVRRDHGLVQLLDPPFDSSTLNPGYIKGYVPGVRENGGQYTHAAVWASMAFAELGDSDRAWELLSLINPLSHSRTEDAVAVYKAEPYVIAADVYAVAPHTGRGGWTWYTGSAGWLYRLIVESLLGLKREGDWLYVTPCMPKGWNEYALSYRYEDTVYRIAVERTSGANAPPVEATLDGAGLAEPGIPLVDDRREHVVRIRINTTP
jgi:cellobiose phosphorylase